MTICLIYPVEELQHFAYAREGYVFTRVAVAVAEQDETKLKRALTEAKVVVELGGEARRVVAHMEQVVFTLFRILDVSDVEECTCPLARLVLVYLYALGKYYGVGLTVESGEYRGYKYFVVALRDDYVPLAVKHVREKIDALYGRACH